MALNLPQNRDFDVVGIGRNSWDRIVITNEYPEADTKNNVSAMDNQAGGQVATTVDVQSHIRP